MPSSVLVLVVVTTFVVFACLLSGCQAFPSLDGLYDFRVNLTDQNLSGGNALPTSEYYLYYSIRPPNIEIGIVCNLDFQPLPSWCGFGLAPNTDPLNADNVQGSGVTVGWVDGTGNTFINEFFIGGKLVPNAASCNGVSYPAVMRVCPQGADGYKACSDNTQKVAAYRNGTYLTLRYARPLAASDICDQPIDVNGVAGGNQELVFAVGPSGNLGTWPFNIVQHTFHRNASQTVTITFSTASTVASQTTGIQATTAVPKSTTGKAATTGKITTGHKVAVSTGTIKGTTGFAGCANLAVQCQSICGNQRVSNCQCTNNSPSASCSQSSDGLPSHHRTTQHFEAVLWAIFAALCIALSF